ncbi:MAG: DUF4145 domain-containing protein [Chitinispirillaceae bacterium]|jgi:hypothetical protein
MEENKTTVLFCPHCGNTTGQTLLITQTYLAKFYGTSDGSESTHEMIYNVVRCETCKEILVYNLFPENYDPTEPIYGHIVYPAQEISSDKVPGRVGKIYEEAMKVKNISPIAFVILARRVLEEICLDKKVEERNLSQALKTLIKNGDIPKPLGEATELIRIVGNAGAHATDKKITPPQVWAIDDFIKVIIEYLYLAPSKIAEFKKRYGDFMEKAKTNEKKSE